MIPVKEALGIILNEIRPLKGESVDILSSLGRVLAEDIVAQRPNPPCDNSAMDGYAVRFGDLKGASRETPVELKVVYDLPAGKTPQGPVGKGEAVRIMTGAPVPPGADAVVMVEETEAFEQGVRIKKEPKKGDNIRKQGEDFNKGDIVIKKGSAVRPAEAGILATVGSPFIFVHKKPRAAIVSTGDELVDIDIVPPEGKITNSNSYSISALVKECGCEPVQLGIAKDTKESLREKLESAIKCDVIISSGGVSVGDYDFVKDVLKDMGSEMRFWKVAMKPGKPLAFGVIGGKPAFGLPGNPISSMVAFAQFVKPALLKMSGREKIFTAALDAVLLGDIKIKPGRMNFLRAELKLSAEGFQAMPVEGQGSGMVASMARANSYIIVPADSSGFKKGDRVKAQPFDSSILLADKAEF